MLGGRITLKSSAGLKEPYVTKLRGMTVYSIRSGACHFLPNQDGHRFRNITYRPLIPHIGYITGSIAAGRACGILSVDTRVSWKGESSEFTIVQS